MIWFGFEDDRFAIESVIQEDFVWRKCGEAFISENETVVDIADMSNEQVVIGKK